MLACTNARKQAHTHAHPHAHAPTRTHPHKRTPTRSAARRYGRVHPRNNALAHLVWPGGMDACTHPQTHMASGGLTCAAGTLACMVAHTPSCAHPHLHNTDDDLVQCRVRGRTDLQQEVWLGDVWTARRAQVTNHEWYGGGGMEKEDTVSVPLGHVAVVFPHYLRPAFRGLLAH
eukprot:351257-Chlamydomonas_euryale.AAC.4